MTYFELNLDGLVGPSHHYAGLSEGNMASQQNANKPANPQAAALQGLAKMRYLHQRGLAQAILPPHQRPNLDLLHRLGFSGRPEKVLQQAYQQAPQLLSAAWSASSMWAANAATVAPSVDTLDGKVHFTAANLISNLHRHQEAAFSKELLEFIFADSRYFHHHPLLPLSSVTGDEGAANHNRLCQSHGSPGLHVFVYGRQGLGKGTGRNSRLPARQTLEASQALARNHLLKPEQTLFLQQNPQAIDAGVFHNDVIAVANESLFLCHEQAFLDQPLVLEQLQNRVDFPLCVALVSASELSLAQAVQSYLFNAQLLSLPGGGMLLLAPQECQEQSAVAAVIKRLLADTSNPLQEVAYLDLKQSMQNGGGPACLRLRIVLNEQEFHAMHQPVIATDAKLDQLEVWVKRHYRDRLTVADLVDPLLIDSCCQALDELTQLLSLGSIYPFQR